MPGYYYGYDGWLIAILLVGVVGAIASSSVNSTFKKYSSMWASCGLSAADVAQRLLYQGGSNATLIQVRGSLTDHFDPKKNTVGLSETVYDKSSVAALAVAAHEIGHVMQYEEGYGPIKFRNAIVPAAKLGSGAAPWLVLLGVFLGFPGLAAFGAALYGVMLVFQLVTLPVEFNASRRALDMLTEGGYISSREEEAAAKKVLRAAAMTYVVAALSVLFSFFRLLSIASRSKRR